MDVYTDFSQFSFVAGPVALTVLLGIGTFLMTTMICIRSIDDGVSLYSEDTRIDVVKAYADHPLVKQSIEDLQKQERAIGYLQSNGGPFVKLSNLIFEDKVLYCDSNGRMVSVASVLSEEKSISRPRWLNYLYVENNTDTPYVLLKDYIARKHNLVFS